MAQPNSNLTYTIEIIFNLRAKQKNYKIIRNKNIFEALQKKR
jgi:hypothetical protein